LSLAACGSSASDDAASGGAGDAVGETGGAPGTGGSTVKDAGTGGGVKEAGAEAGGNDGAANAYSPCPPKGTECAIMPLGDSITDGYTNSIGGGYRPQLFHLALAASKTITFVGSASNGPDTVDGVPFPKAHEGHSGWTIENGCGRSGIAEIVVDTLGTYTPHIVTLMIGTNDVDTSCNLSTAGTRLADLFDSILATDPKLLLVVAQIVPTTDDTENTKVQAFNALIPPLVKTRADAGKHIVTVDMYGAFTANASYKTEYMSDKLHPKDAGFNKMAETWYAAIGTLLK
jgi:lysophospholipase L1-like esterase